MGSTGSKPSSATSSSSSSSSRRIRYKGRRIFKSSCLDRSSRSHDSDNVGDQVCSNQNKESEAYASSANQSGTETDQTKIDNHRVVKLDHQSVEIPSLSSNIHLNEWEPASVPNISSTRTGSSSVQDSSTQSLNPSSHFLSRFSFIPGNVSFRLSRATSLGSSRSFPVSSTSPTSMLNNEDELHSHRQPSTVVLPIDEALPSSNHYGGTSASFSYMASDCDNNNIRVGSDVNLYPSGTNAESNETRLPDRRIGDREPVERNVRFSRTLSVGRLRDRVLRRPSLSDFTFCPLQQESEEREGGSQIGQTRVVVAPEENNNNNNTMASPTRLVYPSSSLSSSLFGIHDYEGGTNRPREARYQDLQEHRSNFLERRRRIRSQVRALQRLGSRFENLSGHERSCILSGQHRTGRCTCQINTREDNINDNNGPRASISRIVMLAEALFEVLDEIHQQSVVLTSQPSISSIGSVPAPNEAVESLPVKLYSKLKKHETDEIPQCYICLVEYEEGDDMRILPCHHEFHRTCVDKWLKEIHRVCPLCRRDICRSEPLSVEN